MFEGKMPSEIRVKGQSKAEAEKLGAVLSIIPFGRNRGSKLASEQHPGFLLGRDSWKDQKVD